MLQDGLKLSEHRKSREQSQNHRQTRHQSHGGGEGEAASGLGQTLLFESLKKQRGHSFEGQGFEPKDGLFEQI